MENSKEEQDSLIEQIRDLKYRKGTLFFLVVNAALGSFLFGYPLGVFNTCLDTIAQQLDWSGTEKDTLSSVFTVLVGIGACIGTLTGGKFAESLGRRKCMIYNNIALCASCALMPWKQTVTLGIGRFFSGVCAGIASVAVPVYIKEICPTHVSGSYGTFHQMFVCVGIAVSYLLGLPLPDPDKHPDDN